MADREEEIFEDESSELFEHYRIEADKGQALLRIDKFLSDRIPNVSRSRIQNGIKEGFVKVNDEVVRANYKIRPGDLVIVSLPEPPRDTDVIPENLELDIVYEDQSVLIVNKPAGMVVHPAYNNWTGTLVNGLVYHFKHLPELPDNEGRPGLIHRIDKDTSGLLVIAKNENALNKLAKQFFDHSIDRTYQAIVWGVPDPEEGTIDVMIGRSIKDRRVVVAYPEGEHGRNAITHYKLIKNFRYVSIIECQLETGRTHQIRAHMKYLGNPIFNDSTYGGDKILKGTVFTKYRGFVQNCFALLPRQALHAKSLGFIHPDTKKYVHFESELPVEFKDVIEKWENYVKYN